MRENKVTNILFIVFTVMALAGTASLVKPRSPQRRTCRKQSRKLFRKTDRRAGTCAGRQ